MSTGQWALSLVVGGVGLLGGCLPAMACAIDGAPSLRANGVGAVLYTREPTRQTLAHWAPFIFHKSFPAGQSIEFSENTQALAGVLPPEVLHVRWIWQMGDGTREYGQVVMHRYAHPGAYRIAVGVALPGGNNTFSFDAALVQIVR